MSTHIHPTAIIEGGAILEEGVRIGAFAYIGGNVHLHKGVTVGHHALVEQHTTVGEGTKIYAHAKVGVTPQDLKYKGEPGRLILGKHNIIRESAAIEIGTTGGGMETRLGDHNMMMINAHIAHDCHVGDRVILGMCAGMAGHVKVGSNVRIASLCGLHQFVRVGDHAFIGLSAIVNRDLLPFSMIGESGKLMGANIVGIRRREGYRSGDGQRIRALFDKIYHSEEGTLQARLEALSEMDLSADERKIIDFGLAESKQGLMTEWQ